MRFIHTPLISTLNDHLMDYPTSMNSPYTSSFGSLAGICLTIQIISGILLVMHYTPHTNFAFMSMEHIMRDVNNGWLIRYIHSNGASIFFIMVYIHLTSNEVGDDYPGYMISMVGMMIFMVMMATAFMGYLLPWGQMSFWGATFITNLFSAIPLIGPDMSQWLWGGFSVDNPTLNRFFSLHYLLPFIIVALVIMHLSLIHVSGSESEIDTDDIDFYPYFYLKDIYAMLLLMLLFIVMVCFTPNSLGHPDNYILANNLMTPVHLVPEWYFLPFYAMLSSTPDKFGGLIMMGVGLLMLFDTATEDDENGLFILMMLGWLGAKPIEAPYSIITQWVSMFPVVEYFFEEEDDEELDIYEFETRITTIFDAEIEDEELMETGLPFKLQKLTNRLMLYDKNYTNSKNKLFKFWNRRKPKNL